MRFMPLVKLLFTLTISTAGGWVMWYFHMPLAWLLGAMIACGFSALLGVPVSLPKFSRPPMTSMLGAMLGASFAPSVFDHLGLWAVSLTGLVAYLLTLGGAVYLYFRQVVGLDRATAFYSAMPGGLVEMVTQGSEKGGDERMIALIHVVRIFLVVLSLPFIIQFVTGQSIGRGASSYVPFSSLTADSLVWFIGSVVLGVTLATILKFPARFFLGPMIVSAVVHFLGFTDFRLPSLMLAGAQIVIGATIGCRFANIPLRYVSRVALMSIGSTFLCISISLAFALAVSAWSGDRFVSLILAYSPGGITEMSLVALSLGIEVPFVVVHHILRVILVLAAAGLLFKK